MLSPQPQRRLPLDIYLFSCFLMPFWLWFNRRRSGRPYLESDAETFDESNALLALIQSPHASHARFASKAFIQFAMVMVVAVVVCIFAYLDGKFSLSWTSVPALMGIVAWIETRRLLSWADQTEE